jgi:predicted permease
MVDGAVMTGDAFALLRVEPVLGRLPGERPVDEAALVVSERLWRDWLDGDPGALGRQVRIGDQLHTLVGVMPEGFHFPYRQDLWTVRDPRSAAWGELEVVARLRPGADESSAAEELQAILARSRRETTSEASTARVRVAGFTASRGESGETTILLGLLMMVLALILVSCANVANLLLERAVARSRSLAIHQAVGAVPGQIVLQVLIEALLIAFLGLLPGLAIAQGVVWFVEETLSDHWGFFWMRVELQPSAVAFAAAVGVVTAMVSGILPALRTRRVRIAGLLQQDARGSRGTRKPWLSWTLITGQVAFSCISVIAAVLMGIGLAEDRRVLPSFPAQSVYWTSVSFDGERYAEAAARRRFRQRLLGELAGEPAIQVPALSTGLPGLRAQVRRLTVDGGPVVGEAPRVLTSAVSPGFFEVFDLRVLQGRALREADAAGAVAVVSEGFVRRHLGGDAAVGRSVGLATGGGRPQDVRIVGVVSNLPIYASDLDRDLDHVYVPLEQDDASALYLTLRAAGGGQEVVAALARAAQAVDPEVPVDEVSPLSDMLGYVRQFLETLGTLAILGGLGAVVVVTIGIYGVVAFDVRRRIPELAVRMALGADTRRLVWGVLRHGLALVVPGVALGLAATYLITPLLGIYLGGADSHDPRVFVGALCIYLLVALLAAAGPARRAAFCNPADVLRDE